MAETITASGVPRTIALSAITVREGFNPRLRFDNAELERLAQSIRKTGVLQPVLVQPGAEGEGEFELVDGERRYRAAFKAGLTEIPALIRSREVETGGLLDALAANFHKAAHTPVEEARAFARLLEAGLTRKGVGERLQVSRELVRERLEILELTTAQRAALEAETPLWYYILREAETAPRGGRRLGPVGDGSSARCSSACSPMTRRAPCANGLPGSRRACAPSRRVRPRCPTCCASPPSGSSGERHPARHRQCESKT